MAASRLNAAVKRATKKATKRYEAQLVEVYGRALSAAGRAAAQEFERLATPTVSLVAAGIYDESKHPRDPGGEGGGRWIRKGETGVDDAVDIVDGMLWAVAIPGARVVVKGHEETGLSPSYDGLTGTVYDGGLTNGRVAVRLSTGANVSLTPEMLQIIPHPLSIPADHTQQVAMSIWRGSFANSSNLRAYVEGRDMAPAYRDDPRYREYGDSIKGALARSPGSGSEVYRLVPALADPTPGSAVGFEAASVAPARSETLTYRKTFVMGQDRPWLYRFPTGTPLVMYPDGQEGIIRGDFEIEDATWNEADRVWDVTLKHRAFVARGAPAEKPPPPRRFVPPPGPALYAAVARAGPVKGVRRIHEGILSTVNGMVVGRAFDVIAAPNQELLDQLGARADRALQQAVREPIARAMAQSYAEGDSIVEAARAIRHAVQDAKAWQAVMLARTDLMSIANGAALNQARTLNRLAPAPVITTKKWVATNDNRTRLTHRHADGQEAPIDGDFKVGGSDMDYPGDPTGPDSEVINCRCTMLLLERPTSRAAVVSAGWDETKHPRDPGGEGGGQWVKKGLDSKADEVWEPSTRDFIIGPGGPSDAGMWSKDPRDLAFQAFDPYVREPWDSSMPLVEGASRTRPGVAWKASYNRDTGEVAMWVQAKMTGYPHHRDVALALGWEPGEDIRDWSKRDDVHGIGNFVNDGWENQSAVDAIAAKLATPRIQRQLREAEEMAQMELAAAGYDPSQPRDPGGRDGGRWVKSGGTTESPHQEFPPGIWDPDDSVTFWANAPVEYSGFSRELDGPFWKAIVDENGEEVAFWFPDSSGRPHHDEMIEALNYPPSEFLLTGYGDKTYEDEYLRGNVQSAILDRAYMIERLIAEEDSHALYDLTGNTLGDWEGSTFDEIRDGLVDDALTSLRRVPVRHRRDIRDANEIIQGRRAMAAAGWDPSKHPREPGGTSVGGRWAKKTGPRDDGLRPDLYESDRRMVEALDSLAEHEAGVEPTFADESVEPFTNPSLEMIEQAEGLWRSDYYNQSEDGWAPNVAGASRAAGYYDPTDWVAELEVRAKEALGDATLKINTPGTAVAQILDDGRFKSQFEVGASKGTFNPGFRATYERKVFGLPGLPRGTPTSWERRSEIPAALAGNAAWLHERPIYGYLEGPNVHSPSAHFYGEVTWEMKPEVKARATFTAGDSLGGLLVPSAVNNPSHLSLRPPYNGSPTDRTDTSFRYPVAADNYVEAQIHKGGVSMEDVAAIHFPEGFIVSDPLEDKLRRAGIPYYVGGTRWR